MRSIPVEKTLYGAMALAIYDITVNEGNISAFLQQWLGSILLLITVSVILSVFLYRYFSAKKSRGYNTQKYNNHRQALTYTSYIENYPYRVETGRYEWTASMLRSLEWSRFEDVCLWYFQNSGVDCYKTRSGPDSGFDLVLKSDKGDILVQCKAWKKDVGVRVVRELLGSMTGQGAKKGMIITSGSFTNDAKKLSEKEGIIIHLMTGEDLVAKINRLPEEAKRRITLCSFEGDFQTPSCPSCSIKMLIRQNRKDGSKFFGCKNFPKCKNTFHISTAK